MHGIEKAGVLKLSVLLLVYNHEQYVAKAIESVFAQQVEFSIELLIGEDCSTDFSREIIERVLARVSNPAINVRRLYHAKNLGMHENLRQLFDGANGQYVALLEGDDYWCDSCKLAKQVDFLDANPDYYLVAHNTAILDDALSLVVAKEWRWNRWRKRFDASDYLRQMFFHTSSILMRRPAGWPVCLSRVKQLDQFIVLGSARESCDKIMFIADSMSVYRKHAAGITSTALHRNAQVGVESMVRGLCELDTPWAIKNQSKIIRQVKLIQVMHCANNCGRFGRWVVYIWHPLSMAQRAWIKIQSWL